MAHKTPKDTAQMIVMSCRMVHSEQQNVGMNVDSTPRTMNMRVNEYGQRADDDDGAHDNVLH